MVTKTIPITLTRVKGYALVKTEADTLAGEKAYLCLDKQNEVEAKALVYTWAYTFPQVKVKSVTNTLRDMEAETPIDTLIDAIRNTLADLMTKALIDALPERLEKH